MQVLLNASVKKLGYRGDIVNVKPGYFRNFLLPKNLAQVATTTLISLAEGRNKKRLMQKEQIIGNAKEVLSKLKGLVVTIKEKVSAKGKLYGSVTEIEIIDAIKASTNVVLEKEFIKMNHIKDLGEHKILVHLGEGLEEEVKIVIEKA